MSLLHDMDLGPGLGLLPGWGVLFYERSHHMYVFHKSLPDWLQVSDDHCMCAANACSGDGLRWAENCGGTCLDVVTVCYMITQDVICDEYI